MRFIMPLCLTLLFSVAVNAAEMPLLQPFVRESRSLTFLHTIESDKTENDTKTLVAEFRSAYTAGDVLPSWGHVHINTVGVLEMRLAAMKRQIENGNRYVDLLAYYTDEDACCALITLGEQGVCGSAQRPSIENAWHTIGFTTADHQQKERLGIGYIAFGFANRVCAEERVTIIQKALGYVKGLAESGALLPIQNHPPTHLVSLIARADEPLIQALQNAEFTVYNTEDGRGFLGFDGAEELRRRLIAVYTL